MDAERKVIVNLGTPDKFTVLVGESVRIPISMNIGIHEPSEDEEESFAGIIIDLSEVKAAAESALEKELIINAEVFGDDGSAIALFFTENL